MQFLTQLSGETSVQKLNISWRLGHLIVSRWKFTISRANQIKLPKSYPTFLDWNSGMWMEAKLFQKTPAGHEWSLLVTTQRWLHVGLVQGFYKTRSRPRSSRPYKATIHKSQTTTTFIGVTASFHTSTRGYPACETAKVFLKRQKNWTGTIWERSESVKGLRKHVYTAKSDVLMSYDLTWVILAVLLCLVLRILRFTFLL